MIKTYKAHYYIERALIKILSDGTVTCTMKEYAPTAEEAAEMKAALEGVDFPKTITARNTRELRKMLKPGSEVYEFIDRKSGEIIMAQERKATPNLGKAYVPWVLLNNGEWAAMEPDGDLPFWKPKKTKFEGGGGRIMIHEGAKSASRINELLENGDAHPWANELREFEHWGMIGGALAPHRADYKELKAETPKVVVYSCDNDYPGETAVQTVSRCWNKSLKVIKFGEKFPPSWDMGDPLPPNLFALKGRYIGPKLKELIKPATWATEEIPTGGKGRPAIKVKAEFAEEWLHCVQPEVFVHEDHPNRIFTAAEFNNEVTPFSHVDDTARLLKKSFSSKGSVLKYIPGEESGIHAGGPDGLYVNTYLASPIEAEKGDAGPWLEFMEFLLPEKEDRKEMLRWCATLIARPDVRMLYGTLLISETQGIGKGTLGEKILAPLVGEINTSYPSEQEIVDSNFNYWIAHKRLAVVHEIYAGHSSKAYNKLKSAITDRFVSVQKKYQANYTIENWIHIFACSNSMRAMKLSQDDRRWFVPKVTEEKQAPAYWDGFNAWLTQDGGLPVIRWWAEEWLRENPAVERGAAAPWSAVKQQIVEEGYSPGQLIVMRCLSEIARRVTEGQLSGDVFVLDTDLVSLIRDELYEGRHNERLERPATVRGVAKALGWAVGEKRAEIKAWGPTTFGARILSLDAAVAGTVPGDLGGERLSQEERRWPLDLKSGAM